jgi:hypothetical protein
VPLKLKIFALADHPPPIARAERTRRWMDDFPGNHPYRCLPLAIANAYGWDLLSPFAFTVTWNGGPSAQDLELVADDEAPFLGHFANGSFTHGVLTLHTGYLFRTEPGWHLVVTGPPNAPKDGIAPLTGVIESDWLPYPFTMNWKLTRPGSVRFEHGEAFCRIFPVTAGSVQASPRCTTSFPILSCSVNTRCGARNATSSWPGTAKATLPLSSKPGRSSTSTASMPTARRRQRRTPPSYKRPCRATSARNASESARRFW